jgi:hypothetical protein
VPREEPGPVIHLELRDADVPAQIGVQRLLLGAEGVEQVQGRLPVVPFTARRRSARACSAAAERGRSPLPGRSMAAAAKPYSAA